MMYFAYGSNCSAAVLERKRVRFRSRVRASLSGYRLKFNKLALRPRLPEGIGFANVEEDEHGTVEGVLYDLLDEDLGRLDESERAPEHYQRVEVTVTTEKGPVRCFTYRARPEKTADGLRPSRNYLNHILGARDFLSRSYFEALEGWQTHEAPCFCCRRIQEVVFVREGERMYTLCQPCREARLVWGSARGRPLTVSEASAVMQMVQERGGFASLQELIEAAVSARLIDR